MSSVCWQIPNVYIPVQSSVPNSRLIYLILLNISTCMFIAFSNFAYPKLNSCIELLLPQQTATSSSWAENSKSFFYSFFSHIPHPICLQSPVSSAFRIQMECDPISPTPPQLLPPSWPLTLSSIIRVSLLVPLHLSPTVCFNRAARPILLKHKSYHVVLMPPSHLE